MGKATKKISKNRKEKNPGNRHAVEKKKSDLPAAVSMNQTSGESLARGSDGPTAFTFVITIVINPAIIIKSVNLEGTIAREENFVVKDGNIICELKSAVSTFSFLLIIEAEGEPDTMTTFNLTCNDKTVFDADRQIKITSTGRGGFIGKEVPLP